VDGHNSHTNICSSGARFGYAIWYGHDRPSPDHANARVILLISAHLESGHYFNPHAQRIIEGKMKGAKLIVLDPRLSATPPAWPTTGCPRIPAPKPPCCWPWPKSFCDEGMYNRDYLENWVNWAMARSGAPDEATPVRAVH
jgi:hypothetical protein